MIYNKAHTAVLYTIGRDSKIFLYFLIFPRTWNEDNRQAQGMWEAKIRINWKRGRSRETWKNVVGRFNRGRGRTVMRQKTVSINREQSHEFEFSR